ncbi:MAG TPA: ABC transporter permease [Verrucomicrobiae bacterium]|nr:ABC transporter permease [Verrucomicrobiae bacterium]
MKLILEPGRAEKNYWRDLWRYRELFIILAWRDVTVRYKQTVIGVAWAVIRPLLTTIVFTVVFSKIAKMPAPAGVPYALLVMAANLPWQFFSTAMSEASNSLIGNANLISKIYFPRLIIPAGSVITSFVDFLITLGLMAALMLWYQFMPDWRLLALPLFMLLAFGAAFGIGLWLCALNVKYRDFRYIVPFLVQFGFFLSPVGYSSTRVPEHWLWHGWEIPARLLYSLNPMVGVIDGFRWCLLRGQSPIEPSSLLSSLCITAALCASGIWYFRRTEKGFADVI